MVSLVCSEVAVADVDAAAEDVVVAVAEKADAADVRSGSDVSEGESARRHGGGGDGGGDAEAPAPVLVLLVSAGEQHGQLPSPLFSRHRRTPSRGLQLCHRNC